MSPPASPIAERTGLHFVRAMTDGRFRLRKHNARFCPLRIAMPNSRPSNALSRLVVACLAAASLHAAAQPAEGYYRQPALRGQQLVFVAEGDLWRVGSGGGQAQRLTTHNGYETQPALSADGQWLAFTGQYDGVTGVSGGDLYVMPAAGGVPKRLTWDGINVRVWGFAASGEILYTAPTQSGQPGTQLYAIDAKTGQRRALPVGQASDGALSTDGKTLYFTRSGLRGDNARQYRGGAIARLWALDLSGKAEAKPLVAEGNNDRRPMPYRAVNGEARIAFLSDRDGTVNIWSVNAEGQDLRQHTRHKGWDIRHASLDGDRVAYGIGADLRVLTLADGKDAKLSVTLGGDFDQQRERFIKKPQDFLTHVGLAPNGERVVLTSRGHLATQGIGPLRRAELPQPADGRCRDAEFGHDSKTVYALCDFGGEVEIWRFPANGLGKAEAVTSGATAMRRSLHPSPDGRWLAHTDKEGHLYLTDLHAKGATLAKEIDRSVAGFGFDDITWSPDGKALAYARATTGPWRKQLQLYMVAEGQRHQLSSDRYDSDAPAFSPDGKWLYFASRRHFAVTGNGGPWGDRNMGPYFDRGTRLYALALQPGLRFPFAPPDELMSAEEKKEEKKPDAKPDEKKDADKKADAGKDEAKKDESKKEEPKKVEPPKVPKLPAIVTADLAARLYEVPLAPGNYSALRVDAKRIWFLDTEVTTERKASLKALPIENVDPKAETVSGEVRDYELSADGKKLMVRRGPGPASEILIVDAATKLPTELAKHQVRWTEWQIATDPKAEWRQMFADAWRMHRDYFYDKDMHGVDWAAMRAKYAPLVERVTDRAELGDVLAQLAGELGALHSQIGMPELRSGTDDPTVAGLGARLSRQADGFRIEQIYSGDPELPNEASPLAAPGVGLKAGDLITSVNGRVAAEVADLSELLRGQAGRQVLLQVRTADGRSLQRIVLPVTAVRERALRYNDWRYARARAVEQAGQGRIGYVHLRAMTRDDIADFAREFYAQIDREGLIIDVRYNGGGNIDSWILEKLLRRAWAYWQRRSPDGSPAYSNMQQTFRGQVVVLANEDTYSDGETFTEGFKRLGLGPVIGKTTSGAGVWLSDGNRLVDNGLMRAAETGQLFADGRFIIEGVGVKPDIEVDNPPRATFEGRDPQLERAIEEVRKRMAAHPMPVVKPGAYPRPVKP